mgnify:CR=1 FL=1
MVVDSSTDNETAIDSLRRAAASGAPYRYALLRCGGADLEGVAESLRAAASPDEQLLQWTHCLATEQLTEKQQAMVYTARGALYDQERSIKARRVVDLRLKAD